MSSTPGVFRGLGGGARHSADGCDALLAAQIILALGQICLGFCQGCIDTFVSDQFAGEIAQQCPPVRRRSAQVVDFVSVTHDI